MSAPIIIVVDDEALLRWAVAESLSTAGFDVCQGESAADAMRCLAEAGGRSLVVVLDLKLPGMSGLGLLEGLQANPVLKDVPVIVYTGRDLSAEEELRLRRYSKSIIIKGAKSPERLLELSPLDRGTLVHEVLERFVAEELARPAAA